MGLLLLWLIAGYLIVGFFLQMDFMDDLRERYNRPSFLVNGAVYFIIYSTVTVFVLWNSSIEFTSRVLLLVLVIIGLHLFLDWINKRTMEHGNKIQNEYHRSSYQAVFYIILQFLYALAVIGPAMILFGQQYDLGQKLLALIIPVEDVDLSTAVQLAFTMVMILVNAFVSGSLIAIVVQPFKPANIIEEKVIETAFKPDGGFKSSRFDDFRLLEQQEQINSFSMDRDSVTSSRKFTFIKDSPAKAGMWIGILERSIIVILTLIGNIASIGFLIAMKALTRFKQFDDKSFAEYYLIGTMLSIILGIIAGQLIIGVWRL